MTQLTPQGEADENSLMGLRVLKLQRDILADLALMRQDVGLIQGQMQQVARGITRMLELLIERERDAGKDPEPLLSIKRDWRAQRENV